MCKDSSLPPPLKHCLAGGGMLAMGGVQTPQCPVLCHRAERKTQVWSIFPSALWHEVWVHSGLGVLSRHSRQASQSQVLRGHPSPQATGNAP